MTTSSQEQPNQDEQSAAPSPAAGGSVGAVPEPGLETTFEPEEDPPADDPTQSE